MVMELIVLFGNLLLALLGAPLIWAICYRVRCWFDGRQGPPLLYLYYDIAKCMRKGSSYSNCTTLVFRIAPILSFNALLLAVALMPAGKYASWLGFNGDLILFVMLFGIGHFWLVLGALDTGTPFGGLGASREAFYTIMVNPAFFLVMAVLAACAGGMTLQSIFAPKVTYMFGSRIMVVLALLMIYLVENGLMPFDSPSNKTELTMVKNGMILDYSGPDYGILQYQQALKIWLLGAILVLSACPMLSVLPLYLFWPVLFLGVLATGMICALVEAMMARLSMPNVPQYLLLGFSSALLALVFLLYR